MRRLFRWLFNGLGKALCLLSLLACVGVGWLWWRGKGPDPHWVEVSVLRRDVWVVSYSDGLSVRVVGRWPGGAGAWAGGMLHDAFPSYKLASKRPSVAPLGPTWRWGNSKVWLESGQLQFHLRPDGTPERLSLLRWFKFKAALLDDLDDRRSEPLPYWEANGVPHWLALTALAVPPVLGLGVRCGRCRRGMLGMLLRRRRRLGLCLRCGYDLRGNTSGKCSECGEKVEAVAAERRATA